MPRRALLLGIDAYEDEGLLLQAPLHDVELMATTLTLVGFREVQIQQRVASVDRGLSTNKLRVEIQRFCNDAKSDDELLIYFSGHGVEWEGHRLLIPYDYYREIPRPRSELLGDNDLYAMARQSPAKSVLFLTDACREGIRLEVAEDPEIKGIGDQSDHDRVETGAIDAPTIAMLYSCEKGEKSYASKECSYFTKALCEALSAEDECATLEEIIRSTQTRLNDILPSGKRQRVSLDERRISGRAGRPEQLIVKEDLAARLRRRIEVSASLREAEECWLWSRIAGESEALADQTRVMIFRCEELVLKSAHTIPRQRWRNLSMPMRVVRRLEQLLRDAPGSLTPPEAALSLVIPYVYEAVLAAAELQLATEGDLFAPLETDEQVGASRLWRALRNYILAEEAMARRRHLLTERGLTEAAEDVASWQWTRFLHESGELWDHATAVSDRALSLTQPNLDPVFLEAPFSGVKQERRVMELLSGRRLMRLARLMFATYEDIELETTIVEPGQGLNADLNIGEYPREWHVNEIKIAHLLCLAGMMGPAPRRLSAVVVDHLAEELTAATLQNVLAQAVWQTDGDDSKGLTLSLECPHEAIDVALQELTQSLDQHRRQLDTSGVVNSDFATGLPTRFSAHNIRAIEVQGQPRFRRPHLHFELDQARVRDLLMGQAMYGEPELALRELYQNALDACRYRRTRDVYLHQPGSPLEHSPLYEGRIIFRAGVEDGRAYIECDDNGIGMAERHLKALFARAGRRFADSHEFHLEKAAWDDANIPFYSNSRFGIGVFSYFMLADEILIETQRLQPDGYTYEESIRATVTGSGSLFRLQLRNAVRPAGGTRIRLYLNMLEYIKKNPLRSVEQWLYIPEFKTMLNFQGEKAVVMAAGEPSEQILEEVGELIPVVGSEDSNNQHRAYWALESLIRGRPLRNSGDMPLLVDGIKIKSEGGAVGADSKPKGGFTT